jgi:DTW domain-containing protein YfiP
MRPEVFCLCDEITSLKTKNKFVILIHPHEFKKVKNNTGRITHLSLEGSEFIMSESFKDNDRVNELIKTTNAYILYPGKGSYTADSIPHKKDITIFIIDATWPCSKKLLKLSPNLQLLPKISFDADKESIYQFKRQPNTFALSTIESTHVLLNQLNDANIEVLDKAKLDVFLNPFKKLIKIQLECENDPNLKGYRKKVTEK